MHSMSPLLSRQPGSVFPVAKGRLSALLLLCLFRPALAAPLLQIEFSWTELLFAALLFTLFAFALREQRLRRRLQRQLLRLALDEADPDLEDSKGESAELVSRLRSLRQEEARQRQSLTRQVERAGELLHQQKEALDQHAIVAMTDLRGSITYCNDKFVELSGYARSELIGQNHRLLNSGMHSKEFFREMYREITHGRTWQGVICNRAKDGHLYWLQTTIVPTLDSSGKPMQYVALRTDISTRKESELRLENTLGQLEATLEASMNGTLVTDPEDRLLRWNSRFARYWRLEPALLERRRLQPLLRRLREACLKPEVFDSEMKVIRASDEAYETQLELQDGRSFEWTVRPMRHEERFLGRVWSFRDITQEQKARRALTLAMEETRRANRTKSEFLANMSHEIRTPMNGVLGLLRLLLDSDLKTEQQQLAHLAHRSAESLLSLLNDVLDMSRIEAGKLVLEEVEFDLADLLGEIGGTLALQAEEKDIELLCPASVLPGKRYLGDPNRLRQVLVNLIHNGIKFSQGGSIQIRCMEGRSTGQLRFEVKDEGIGLSAEQKETLFRSFQQVDRETARKVGGSGLGLSICRQLCEQMGGSIGVNSLPGKGSTFWFTVQLKPLQPQGQPDTELLPAVETRLLPSSRAQRHYLEELLQRLGRRVLCLPEGRDPLDWLAEERHRCEGPLQVIWDRPPLAQGYRAFQQSFRKRLGDERLSLLLLMRQGMLQRLGPPPADLGLLVLAKPMGEEKLRLALKRLLRGETRHPLQHLPDRRSSEAGEGAFSGRVLVADDHPESRLVLRGFLDKLDLESVEARNGEEALQALRSQAFDLVLMDCAMPLLDGFETTRRIRQGDAGDRHTRTPVVALTAWAMPEDRERCLEAGMSDFLAKPLQPEALRAVLEQHLDRRESAA